MALLVDDILSLPIQLFEIIFNTVAQSAYKGVWSDYKRRLNIILMRLHRDYHEGKITKKKMQAVEQEIFREMRYANAMLASGQS